MMRGSEARGKQRESLLKKKKKKGAKEMVVHSIVKMGTFRQRQSEPVAKAFLKIIYV